jgi:hypothetical protein
MVRGSDTNGVAGFTVFPLTAAAGASATGEVRTRYLPIRHIPSDFAPNGLESKTWLDVTGLFPGHLNGVAGEFHRVPVRFGRSSQEGISIEFVRPARSVSAEMYEEWSRVIGPQSPLCWTTVFAVAGPARGPPRSAQSLRSVWMSRRSIVRSGLNRAFTSRCEQNLYRRILSVCARPLI